MSGLEPTSHICYIWAKWSLGTDFKVLLVMSILFCQFSWIGRSAGNWQTHFWVYLWEHYQKWPQWLSELNGEDSFWIWWAPSSRPGPCTEQKVEDEKVCSCALRWVSWSGCVTASTAQTETCQLLKVHLHQQLLRGHPGPLSQVQLLHCSLLFWGTFSFGLSSNWSLQLSSSKEGQPGPGCVRWSYEVSLT